MNSSRNNRDRYRNYQTSSGQNQSKETKKFELCEVCDHPKTLPSIYDEKGYLIYICEKCEMRKSKG